MTWVKIFCELDSFSWEFDNKLIDRIIDAKNPNLFTSISAMMCLEIISSQWLQMFSILLPAGSWAGIPKSLFSLSPQL
jgi:hypothetical protein